MIYTSYSIQHNNDENPHFICYKCGGIVKCDHNYNLLCSKCCETYMGVIETYGDVIFKCRFDCIYFKIEDEGCGCTIKDNSRVWHLFCPCR